MIESVSGGGHFGGGIFINTLDQARFGLLFLRKGKWKNKQLISEQWVNSVGQPSAANRSYGLMWWTNQENQLGNISKNIYYANGFGGNFIVVDLSLIHISEPTRLLSISYAVFCLKKKKNKYKNNLI